MLRLEQRQGKIKGSKIGKMEKCAPRVGYGHLERLLFSYLSIRLMISLSPPSRAVM